MQTFQQYYPINQNYNQQMQPNPYMQRMEQLQQFQQSLQPPIQQPIVNQFPALGKIVESIDIVKATDIPMDGNMYYFPTADGSAVFGKRWLSNGQTQILAFKPILEEETIKSSTNDLESLYGANKEVLEGILYNLNTSNEKVVKISKAKTPTRAKKGEVADE